MGRIKTYVWELKVNEVEILTDWEYMKDDNCGGSNLAAGGNGMGCTMRFGI